MTISDADLAAIEAALVANAQKPQSAMVDGNSVTQHSLKDLIAALDHAAGEVASDPGHRGLRFTKFIMPGCG